MEMVILHKNWVTPPKKELNKYMPQLIQRIGIFAKRDSLSISRAIIFLYSKSSSLTIISDDNFCDFFNLMFTALEPYSFMSLINWSNIVFSP